MTRLPTLRESRIGLGLLLLLLLVLAGLVLLRDRPGLRADYFALGQPWQGEPLNSGVGPPRLDSASQVGEALRTKVVFSIRWRGWWWVEQAGEHRFTLQADDGGYLRIDGEPVVEGAEPSGETLPAGSRVLDPGFHRIEVGLHQRYGESRLALDWSPPGSGPEAAGSLPLEELYSGRPLLLRRGLRRSLASWPRPYRQLLGVVLLLGAVLLGRRLGSSFRGPAARLRERLRPATRALTPRRTRALLLLALFAVTFFAVLPYTGTVTGGDDTAYLEAATFNYKKWFFNRYGHVYLLKLFTALGGGDPLVGVRLWWSFAFATTVAALALAVRSVGPGLQLRTLAVTLFVLFAQTPVLGLIGNGFADYSAMMFVTLAVAVALHGLALYRQRPPPRHEWHALAVGALTVGAFRSKEVGAITLLLPLLFASVDGGVDLRRFARRLAYWAAGAVAVLATLVLLDGWLLGEPLFTLDSDRLAQSRRMNFPSGQDLRGVTESWFHAIWSAHLHEANLSLRNLWLGVCAAALAAGYRRTRIELRLLHLLPLAYVMALIALYVRMPHPISTRMLITILPVASLMAGLFFLHAGLEEVSWRRLLAPAVLIPTTLAAALMFLLVIPYRLGRLDAADLLPAELLSRHGWTPDLFVVGVLLPVLLLLGVAGLMLVAGRRPARLAALAFTYVALFGVGFEFNRASLAKRWAVQTGELLQYPWRTFGDQIAAVPGATVALSADLAGFFNMSATTRTSLACVVLRRPDVWVLSTDAPVDIADLAIASRYSYDDWVRQRPALAATATFGPGGFLVLTRPKQAAEQGAPVAQQRGPTISERLQELARRPDPEERRRLLQWILDRFEGSNRVRRSLRVQTLAGERVLAVGLDPDGWTQGAEPAGIILRNFGEEPLRQPLRLTVHAPASEYPLRVFVDDGDERRIVRFERGRSRKIWLRPLPRRGSRLVTVWAEKGWPAKREGDSRLLGVRIRALQPR